MLSRVAADIVLVVHFGFVLFVIAGALIVMRYPIVALLHVPAATWGAFIELTGRICPLTTAENYFRRAAGEAGYTESFIEHYIVPIIYPAGLTRTTQYWLAAIVVAVNVVLYAWIIIRRRSARPTTE